jgi:hypothetical protein
LCDQLEPRLFWNPESEIRNSRSPSTIGTAT